MDVKKHTHLPKLSVGDQEGTQGTEAVEGLVAMLLGGTLVNGCAGNLGTRAGYKSRLP